MRTRAHGTPGDHPGRSAEEHISLDDFLPALINRLAARLVAAFTKETEKHGISVPEWRVLVALDERSPLRLGELMESTSIEMSTLSRLVRRLSDRNLCEIEVYGKDSRIASIGLSDAAKKLLRSLLPTGRAYERAMIANMSPQEIEASRRSLRKFHENLKNYLASL